MTTVSTHILVVDDEPDICELLQLTLSRMGHQVSTALNIAEASELLANETFNLCLTDMRLPDGDGISLVEQIQTDYPGLPVAVITAHGSIDSAIRALKAGAFDFVSKPLQIAELRKMVSAAITPNQGDDDLLDNSPLVGQDPLMQTLKTTIGKVARTQAPVLVSGESGTGKELVARLIHNRSPRRDGPFVAINCGAIPSELLESEFFGYRKGSFSGANEHKIGLFQAADGGTLFLDEVADLPLNMQVKLLRAIQERCVRPIGSNQETPIDVRIVSATHKDLAAAVAKEQFRNDLFYRINVIHLPVPSLREHPADIPLLAEHLLQKLANAWEFTPPTLSPDAIGALQSYAFPGNVRELENILERAATLCESNQITAQDLDLELIQSMSGAPSASTSVESAPKLPIDLEQHLLQIEQTYIQQALEQTRWNRTEAATLLGISFRQLRYKLKKMGID